MPSGQTAAEHFADRVDSAVRRDPRIAERFDVASSLEARVWLHALGCYRPGADFALPDCVLEVGRRMGADYVVAGRLYRGADTRRGPQIADPWSDYRYEITVLTRVGDRVSLAGAEITLDTLLFPDELQQLAQWVRDAALKGGT